MPPITTVLNHKAHITMEHVPSWLISSLIYLGLRSLPYLCPRHWAQGSIIGYWLQALPLGRGGWAW